MARVQSPTKDPESPITFTVDHDCKVYSCVLDLVPQVAMLYGRIVGSYHGTGHIISAWVSGRDVGQINLSEDIWRQDVLDLEGHCHHWTIIPYGKNLLVKFPYSDTEQLLLYDACPSANWVNVLGGFVVERKDEKALTFLTKEKDAK